VGAGDGGELRVACAQSLTVSLLAPVIQRWHTDRQQVAITLRESADAAELLGWLDDLTADVVLMPGPVSERYVSTAVTEEEIVLTTSADHPLASVGTVRIEDLDGVALVHFAQDNGLSDWLDHVLARHGVRTKVVMRTSITSAVPQLAAAGLGVAVTPVSAVSAGLPASVRPFTPRWTRQLVAVTPTLADPLAAQFVAHLARRGVRPPDDVTRQLTRDRGGRGR